MYKSQVYVLLGAAGVPVFAGFRAGISVLAGPTGGYIIGYIVAVFIIGVRADVLVKRSTAGEQTASGGRAVKETLLYALAMVIGLLICYAFGTAWFMISTGTGLSVSYTHLDVYKRQPAALSSLPEYRRQLL